MSDQEKEEMGQAIQNLVQPATTGQLQLPASKARAMLTFPTDPDQTVSNQLAPISNATCIENSASNLGAINNLNESEINQIFSN